MSLLDKYLAEDGVIFLSGIQALTRLPLVQRTRDQRAGLNTAGFISGYRGSPLAGLDQQLWRAKQQLDAKQIRFVPGINEDLAATAVWGSQMSGAFPGAIYDGVFAMWYGKAPGVDRSLDAIRHANAAGSAQNGGVLAIAGDDHQCKSSTLPSQSEYAFMDVGIPVLNPADVQEVLDYGIYGWAMSRYTGCWTAMIALADTMDSSATVVADIDRVQIVRPAALDEPPGGLHFQLGLDPLAQEEILHVYKLEAAIAFCRANGLNRTVLDSPRARFGIVTTGKAYLDVRQALDDLGITERVAADIGLRLHKVGMPWPLDPHTSRGLAKGLEEILVVEEKRGLIEGQLKEHLYGTTDAPRIVGKKNEHGAWLLPSTGDLAPGQIARVIAERLAGHHESERLRAHIVELNQGERARAELATDRTRAPTYCSGCPHNRSTLVPEGSRGLAGIGCHYMVVGMGRNTDVTSQMGGEGVHWIGQAPFTSEEHVFANLGDGTYFHSGLLAIRAAIAAGVNITYKILYNDAVAMTGGQPIDGQLTVGQITRQLAAEGVRRIAVVTQEKASYPSSDPFAPGVTFHQRQELDAVQKELRTIEGCTCLIYDQTCAAELRRRRKRGLAADPTQRIFINEALCEGCGDCTVQSNCIAVEPVETDLGRKRAINQHACNKDYSCLEGLCPALFTVHGGSLRKVQLNDASLGDALDRLPPPQQPQLDTPWRLLITGVGGTGVVTMGSLLGVAAHLESKACTLLDMTGLAQKGGAVLSHVTIARGPNEIRSPRIPLTQTDALLATDLIVAAGSEAIGRLAPHRTHTIINTNVAPTAEFLRNTDVDLTTDPLVELVRNRSQQTDCLDASDLAQRLLGDAVATNVFMLGYAFQRGLIPLGSESLERAMELNGVAVEMNQRAFALGRLAAHDPEALNEALAPISRLPAGSSLSVGDTVDRNMAALTRYQDAAYAERYRDLVQEARTAQEQIAPHDERLTAAVARYYYKLLAYKDEYEVARLYTDDQVMQSVRAELDGKLTINLHFAPPLWARTDPATGRTQKSRYGPWIFWVLELLAGLRFLRGTWLDPFGRTKERKLERKLIVEYATTIRQLRRGLRPDNYELAVKVASLPDQIRGFGQIKIDSATRAAATQAELMIRFCASEPTGRPTPTALPSKPIDAGDREVTTC